MIIEYCEPGRYEYVVCCMLYVVVPCGSAQPMRGSVCAREPDSQVVWLCKRSDWLWVDVGRGVNPLTGGVCVHVRIHVYCKA